MGASAAGSTARNAAWPRACKRLTSEICSLARLARPSYNCAMNEEPKNANRQRQEERLRAALRENLKRRRAQARSRALGQEGEREPHDSAGIPPDKKGG
jgi:hypothetical protein